jgi:GntR family transcriptional regulator / MocR family aminotransferase
LHIPLDRQSGTPLYQQIQDYLREHILSGQLSEGTRLPATRKLARQLGISRITVQNAYADLESEGLVNNREGSGAYVSSPPIQSSVVSKDNNANRWPLWQQELAGASRQQSVEVNAPHHPAREVISFTGVGDPHQFPLHDLSRALRTALQNKGSAALEYGQLGAGYLPLRQKIVHILASRGIHTHPDNILITSGSQQALALVCQALLRAGDVVVVEKPTYNLALELFRTLGLRVLGVEMDADGMQVERLHTFLQQQHPRLIFTIPNFQNPSGICMSSSRRRLLLDLGKCYNVPILEDDFAGDLRYSGRSQPAIKALDADGHVIYIGTFSKMLMPGLRVGYLAANGPIFDRLVQLKRVSDLATSTLMQHALHEYVTVGRYQVHLRRSTRLYRKRMDAMLAAVHHYLPSDVQVIPPRGGLFLWLRLPDPLSVIDLLPLSAEAGVAFSPGTWFFPQPDEGKHFLRLNFAVQTPQTISEGIGRLGTALEILRNAVN